MTRQSNDRRRGAGEGSLYWDEARGRWIASVTVRYDGRGRRVRRKAAGRTKSEARARLREMLREQSDGLPVGELTYTVADAVHDWLTYGLTTQSEATRTTLTILCETHVLPHLGAVRLRDLSAEDVDRWLATLAPSLSTRSLRGVRACLNRAVRRAMARDKVKRNVVELCSVPEGRPGRRSKALTALEADAVLNRTREDRLHPYIVVSMLTGARTEELRALRWDHVYLDGRRRLGEDLPPHMEVWRSVRAGGDTKTRKSRRTIALPARCVEALRQQREQQERDRGRPGWVDTGLVFTSSRGTPLDASHVRRDFRRALAAVPGIDPAEWTPRELRHSFVSLLSDAGVPLEEISRLAGHSGTSVTELVYRHQIRPVIQTGATIMDRLFQE